MFSTNEPMWVSSYFIIIIIGSQFNNSFKTSLSDLNKIYCFVYFEFINYIYLSIFLICVIC